MKPLGGALKTLAIPLLHPFRGLVTWACQRGMLPDPSCSSHPVKNVVAMVQYGGNKNRP